MLIHPQFDTVAIRLGPIAVHWYGITYLAAFGLFPWLGFAPARETTLATRTHAEPVYASMS